MIMVVKFLAINKLIHNEIMANDLGSNYSLIDKALRE